MDLAKIRALIDLVGASQIAELELDDGVTKVRITRSACGELPQVTDGPDDMSVPPPARPQELSNTTLPPGTPVSSPMIGVFYRRPSPSDAPFVEVGTQVQTGDTLALVEAMKVLNKVVAERPGTVRAILAEDGALVEDDQPLFLLD